MTERPFFFKKRFWLSVLKSIVLLFVGFILVLQLPELRYDFGSKKPLEISAPQDLEHQQITRSRFVSIAGTPDFEHAFIYQRYGLNYTYFTIAPYGMTVIVRTYDTVTDEWKNMTNFVGKLRPFNKQPFSYAIRKIYKSRFDIEIPEGSYFLALRDVPKPSGWQIGVILIASTLWIVMLYTFFLRGRRR